MNLTSVADVLSRRFLVAYFAPWFVVLLCFAHAIDAAHLPPILHDRSEDAVAVISGGAALVTGLILQAIWHPIVRLLAGYPFEHDRLAWLGNRMERHHEDAVQRLREESTALRDSPLPETTDAAAKRMKRRQAVARKAEDYYPPPGHACLPTAFGNALRAFERYPNDRWGIDGVVFWPRIEPLLGESERTLNDDAATIVDFLINALIVSAVWTAAMTADGVAAHVGVDWSWIYRLGPVLVIPFFYREAVNAAVRWGVVVRASFDLHHAEVLQRLGFLPQDGRYDAYALAEDASVFLRYSRRKPPIAEPPRSESVRLDAPFDSNAT